MDRLRLIHYKTILRRELLNFLKALGFKKILIKLSDSKKAQEIKKQIENINVNNRTIVVLPNMPWTYRKQRPQQIFLRLGKKGFNVFYVSPATSERESISEISENVFEVNVRISTPKNVLDSFSLDKEETVDFVNSMKKQLSKYIKKDSLLFVLHPVWKDVALSFDSMEIVYDLMDLYSGFPDAKEELVRGEEELIERSDIIITTADNLYSYAKKLNDNTYIVKNGSDYEKFSNPEENGILDNLKDKPIIGYYGAISDWFDFDLVEYLVEENKDKNFVFIGYLNTKRVRKLYKYKNVYFLGEVLHDKLPGYLAYFDVCTIPFIVNELIASTNPVKFYEYISSGKPVVSVDLSELRQYSDICYLAKNKEDFNKKISIALNEDRKELATMRKEVAKENSWDSRVKDIIKIIE